MKMNSKKLLFIYFALFYTIIVSAQSRVLTFSHIDINNGLSHNQVNCIFKDSHGFIWFGTMSGLDRYDGNSFKIFKHSINNPNALNDNFIKEIVEDPQGKLWVFTRLYCNIYNPEKESFTEKLPEYLLGTSIQMQNITKVVTDRQKNFWIINNQTGPYCYRSAEKKLYHLEHIKNDAKSIASNNISTIVQDNEQNIWLINREGVIEKLDCNTLKVIERYNALKTIYREETQDYNLIVDADNDLWISMSSFPKGVYMLNTKKNTFNCLNKDSGIVRLNTNNVSNLIQDNEGLIWIGTDHGGINIFDKKRNTIKYILSNPEDNKGLSQNSITTLYKDNSGIIWAGTYKKGVDYYHENLVRFRQIKHEAGNARSIGTDDINCFAEDKLGNLWIGTNGSGLYYFDRSRNTFTQHKHVAGNSNSISNDIIVKLYFDKSGLLWIGTYYGGLNVFDGKKFIQYKCEPSNPLSLSDDRVWEIMEDAKGRFWVGTLGGGLNYFDRSKKVFYHYKGGGNNSVRSNYIICAAEDRKGNIWFGTAQGIDVLDMKSNTFIHIAQNADSALSLSNNNIVSLHIDKRGLIWVGTREGLNLFDDHRNLKRIFREEDGLPDNAIVSMLEDKSGNLWIGTPNGISNLIIAPDTSKFIFKNYDKTDGLQGKDFNERSAFITRNGELLFGGANGFNLFYPQEIIANKEIPKVVITNLQIFNKNIRVDDNSTGRVILDKSIVSSEKIRLKYSENVFSIEFAALNYLHPEKNSYRYKLEGFSKEWLTADPGQLRATFTNLDPGNYKFVVIASNDDGYWNNTGASLLIRISPPWWRSPLAFIIYILLIIGILYFSRRMILQRARLRFLIENERIEAQRMHEVDMMKIRFFTNISHEFRTPLSLIVAPVEKLLKNSKDEEQRKQYTIIHRNARRLLNLVNQLLDFRRMEVQEFQLNNVTADIVAFIKDSTYSFSDISESKNIELSFTSKIENQEVAFDPDKLEKILFNLLSNAFKFTLQGGKVSVEVERIASSDRLKAENGIIEIKIKDTGIGVVAEKHEKIFEQFFQNEIPGNMINQGSGIGLSITREFVKLHNGVIYLESEPGKGSCFTILLPIKTDASAAQYITDAKTVIVSSGQNLDSDEAQIGNKPLILIVEDNEDLRFYLKDNLKARFQIAEAGNGNDALALVKDLIPDIVVSDIMMPGIDGIELCKRIKSEKQTSHIPVILLTARTTEEQKIEGLQSGADDYVTKPFNFEILESRIDNLINQREVLRKSFQKHISVNTSEINIVSLDDKLIQKALEIVEKSISNPDFSVEELSRELGMSRVHLYKKLLAITGKTPIEFIRIVRLKRAAQLLLKSQLTVAEVAYEVGFNSPKYFARYFKEEFNILPSQYADKQKDNNG